MKPDALLSLLVVACALLAQFASPAAQAQAAWPAKPIRWIVPFAPGGPTDIVSRLVAPKLAERLGQPVIIDNRAGAAGNIGAEAVMKSAPDGYNLLYVVPAIVTNPFFFKGSPDPKEFAAVIQISNVPMVLIASTGFAPKTLSEIVAQVRAKPGTVSCGSSGAIPTVGCELLRSQIGADMIMVMYKGNAPALNALMGGEINLLFDVVNTSAPQVKAGRVRAIASMNAKRGGSMFPDLPAAAETIPDFELVTWHGVMAALATPRDIILRLNREIAAVLAQSDVRQRLTETGFDIVGGSVEAFEEFVRRESAKYARVLKEAGIKPE
jgi:tripartite-type tricarboxylate transporter receptor subunit TctC